MMQRITKELLNQAIVDIENVNDNIDTLLDVDKYIYFEDLDDFNEKNKLEFIPLSLNITIPAIFKYFKYIKEYNNLIDRKKSLNYNVDDHNRIYLDKKHEIFEKECGKVENRELDYEQVDAIVREDKNQLVIAGAGCGKTTTIVGKVKYLVKVLGVKPEEILLLSFTRKSAADMKLRVEKEIGSKMECYTFHKLGLDITKQELNDVSIFEGNLHGFIKNQLQIQLQNEDYMYALLYFLTEHIHLIKDEFSIKTEEEYRQYIEINPPTTIKGEIVKSYGEMEIANYLFSNNINYEYESLYKYPTDTSEYGAYHPDFYLPDYNIYIEYFGIDREGNVPSYYKSRHGKSPKEEYNDGIEWKKDIHKTNNTILIDLYYYENKEGTLKATLEDKLRRRGVVLNPLTTNDIFRYIESNNRGLIDGVTTSFETIINLIKSNNYTIAELRDLAERTDYADNIKVTLDLVEPLFDEYDEYLAKNKLIDFNDMINLATSIVSSGKYKNNYKYVIIDEFQDISNSRYKLLKALRDSNDYKLYCVGDDFQSIYRFAGSDIGIFTNFDKYFGSVQISKIERTHRFSDMLSIVSGNFIMKNPNQIKKRLKGYKTDSFPVSLVNAYNFKSALSFLEEKLNNLEDDSSVLFLGRYNFDIELLKDNTNFVYTYDKEKERYKVIYKNKRSLKIEFLTAHKSKGLEADYVVVLNTRRKGMGFPSKMAELPAIQLLLDSSDDYPFSEERRLFYVALTRARKKVFLLVDDNNKSTFIKELENQYSSDFKKEKYECPMCGGTLIVKNGQYGRFLGCNNYPECDYTKNIKE